MSLVRSTKEHMSLLPATIPEDMRDEATLNAFKMMAEYKDAVEKDVRRARSTPSKKESIKMMRGMYKEGKMEPKMNDTVGPAQDLRMRILSASLFPNLYNRKMVMTQSGPE